MLATVDLTKSLTRKEYTSNLIRYQVALQALGYQVYVQQRPVAMVFEGWDAGGKGGNIKRATEKLDPRGYVVYPIGAPAGEDRTHHYLWRFWRRLPEMGQIAIFDRSWYGRVLVERIEGFCTEQEWKRAYREINHFERQLVDFGTILFKFWIHIGRDEQLRRFEARKDIPHKAWKLTDEDWRNRAKWDKYEDAVNEMLLKTSTLAAPWTVVEGNSKWYARVKVLKTLVEGLTSELGYGPAVTADEPSRRPHKRESKERTGRKRKVGEPEDLATVSLPMIDRFKYGSLVIDGEIHTSDIVISPDGLLRPRAFTEKHVLHPEDLAEIIKTKPQVLVIGSGTVGNLVVHPKAAKRLQRAGIEVLAYRTHKACETYRELRGQRRLAAILHITS